MKDKIYEDNIDDDLLNDDEDIDQQDEDLIDEDDDQDDEDDDSEEEDDIEEDVECSIEQYLEDKEHLIGALRCLPEHPDIIKEILIRDAILCEKYDKMGYPSGKITELCEDILKYLPVIEKSLPKYTHKDQMKDFEELKKGIVLYNVATRSTEKLFKHPRLKHKILETTLKAMKKMRMQDFPAWSISMNELDSEVKQLGKNIYFADKGELERIESTKRLKTDPVEWTEGFEKVIDEAERKAEEKLKDTPKGRGYSHARWKALQEVLLNGYGIQWKHPGQLNPTVRFD